MLPGRTVIELVNYGFENANWRWLSQYARLLNPVIRLRRVVLSPLPGEAPPSPCVSNRCKKPGDEHGLLIATAWNKNGSLHWPMLRQELEWVVRNATTAPHSVAFPRWVHTRRTAQISSSTRDLGGMKDASGRALRTLAAHTAALPPLAQLVALPTAPVGLQSIASPPRSGVRLVVLIPYFGTLPQWLPLNFASMGGPNADDVSFFIVGDALLPVGVAVPPNVHFVRTTWGELQQRVKLHLGVDVSHDSKSVYRCKDCVYYDADHSTVNASTIAAERVARQAGKLIHHMSKVNDMKPFLAVLFSELIAGATWWAWADIDVVWGDIPRFLDAAPEGASFLCPLYPNPWGVMTRAVHRVANLAQHNRCLPTLAEVAARSH